MEEDKIMCLNSKGRKIQSWAVDSRKFGRTSLVRLLHLMALQSAVAVESTHHVPNCLRFALKLLAIAKLYES